MNGETGKPGRADWQPVPEEPATKQNTKDMTCYYLNSIGAHYLTVQGAIRNQDIADLLRRPEYCNFKRLWKLVESEDDIQDLRSYYHALTRHFPEDRFHWLALEAIQERENEKLHSLGCCYK